MQAAVGTRERSRERERRRRKREATRMIYLPSGTESSSREVSVTGFKRLLTFISIFGLTRGVWFLLLRGRGFLGSDPHHHHHHHHHRCEDCGWCSQFSQHCGSSPFSADQSWAVVRFLPSGSPAVVVAPQDPGATWIIYQVTRELALKHSTLDAI